MKQTKRILLTSLFVIIMILSTVAMASCDEELTIAFYVGENKYDSAIIAGNETINLPQNPNKSGYTFDGWFLDPETWENPFYADSLVNNPAEESVQVYAKFTAITYTVKYNYDPSFGDYPVNATENPDTYNTELTGKLTSLVYKDDTYDFEGWFTDPTAGKKIETFNGITGNLELYARWSLHKYPIVYHDVNGASVVPAENAKSNPKNYTIESMDNGDIPILALSRVGYIFEGWFLDQDHTEPAPTHIVKGSTGALDFYAKWSKDESKYIIVDAEGKSDPNGDYILFGTYPQASVKDSNLTSVLNDKASENENLWTSYGYYAGNGELGSQSNSVDFMWYIDIEYNGDEYRGVYFTEYRPAYTSHSYSDSYQDNTGHSTSTIYWFKYDFIKWKIVEKDDNNNVLLLCESLIDAQSYQSSYTYSGGHYYATDSDGKILKDENGLKVLANNYAYSTIRSWLNNEFYNTAFSDLQKSIIQLTAVDNSAATTDTENNSSACENTNDFVFLQSFSDMTNKNYGYNENPNASDTAKKKKPTEYALAQGASLQRDYQNADSISWWLRSPDGEFEFSANTVANDGYLAYNESVYATYHGVCPALWISLD